MELAVSGTAVVVVVGGGVRAAALGKRQLVPVELAGRLDQVLDGLGLVSELEVVVAEVVLEALSLATRLIPAVDHSAEPFLELRRLN